MTPSLGSQIAAIEFLSRLRPDELRKARNTLRESESIKLASDAAAALQTLRWVEKNRERIKQALGGAV